MIANIHLAVFVDIAILEIVGINLIRKTVDGKSIYSRI